MGLLPPVRTKTTRAPLALGASVRLRRADASLLLVASFAGERPDGGSRERREREPRSDANEESVRTAI
jgi:hypothetical protein